MSGTTSDSDAETVITEGTTDGGKVNKEKGKVSQIADQLKKKKKSTTKLFLFIIFFEKNNVFFPKGPGEPLTSTLKKIKKNSTGKTKPNH